MTLSIINRVPKALLFGAALLFATARPVSADTIFIVGNTHPDLATATFTGEFNAQTNTFTGTIVNTSDFEAVITSIAFDLPPTGCIGCPNTGLDGFTGAVIFQPAGVNFTFSDGALGNVNQFNNAVLDFGFLTGSNFSGGDPQEGLPPGIDPGEELTFVVSGANFAGLTEEQIVNAIFVRFQSVGADQQLSDVGVPCVVDCDGGGGGGGVTAPEPASLTLLGLGFVLAARRMRRQQH